MINKIAVLGAGTMGHGIAETFAVAGLPVNLYETYEPMRNAVKDNIKVELEQLAEHGIILEKEIDSSLGMIEMHDDLKKSVGNVDYVIEAIPEEINMKRKLFTDLDEYCSPETIIASNTSSFSLEKMTANISEPRMKKVMLCHWYNPAHIMPLVELSFFGNMSKEDYEEVEALYSRSGKQTIKVKKDIPGLISSRINMGVAREVFSLMEEGIADPADIDRALKYGPAFSYATTGQLEATDLGGLDIWSTVGDNLLALMDNSQEANGLLKAKVRDGKLGMKSGEGFFKYDRKEKQKKQIEFHRKLIIQLKASQNYGG